MKKYRKQPFDPANTRRLLEPGPVVLVTSAWHYRGEGEFMISGREVNTLRQFPNQTR